MPRLRRRRSSLRNGIEVGNIFKLGTKYTEALGAEYLGEDGERHPDRHGLVRHRRSGRNVACIVEAHHDEKGIIWPREVAPYAAHLVALGASKEPRSARSPIGSTTWRHPRVRATRSCTTIATSRPA